MHEGRIIIVDDHKAIREVMTQLLEVHGYTVVGAAEDGDSATKLIKNLSKDGTKVDILLVDKNFPNGGGERVVKIFNEVFKEAVSIGFTSDPDGVPGAAHNALKPSLDGVLQIIADLPQPATS